MKLTVLLLAALMSLTVSANAFGWPQAPAPESPAPAPAPATSPSTRDAQSPAEPGVDIAYTLVALPIAAAAGPRQASANTALASARTVAVFYDRGACLDEAARLNRTGNPFLYTCVRGLR